MYKGGYEGGTDRSARFARCLSQFTKSSLRCAHVLGSTPVLSPERGGFASPIGRARRGGVSSFGGFKSANGSWGAVGGGAVARDRVGRESLQSCRGPDWAAPPRRRSSGRMRCGSAMLILLRWRGVLLGL